MIKAGIPILIKESDLYKYVSQEELAYRYINNFRKIGEAFKSEFRTDDKDPSSRVFIGNNGKLYFKDFGSTDLPRAISIINYLKYKYNLSYQEVLNKIALDFKIVGANGNILKKDISSKRSDVSKKGIINLIPSTGSTVIKIKKRLFREHDVKYWGQFGISLQQLERNNICAISHLWINNNPPIEFAKDFPVYSYNYYISKISGLYQRKIYQPLSENGYKWLSNVDVSTVQGFNILPKKGGKLLIITSSLKDAMCLNNINKEYYALAPNSESTFIPEDYFKKLQKRWDNIILMFDNDEPGIRFAKQISEKYNLPYIYTPVESGSKDISDFVKDYGIERARILMNQLLKDIII